MSCMPCATRLPPIRGGRLHWAAMVSACSLFTSQVILAGHAGIISTRLGSARRIRALSTHSGTRDLRKPRTPSLV